MPMPRTEPQRIPGRRYGRLSTSDLQKIRKALRACAKKFGYQYGFCACGCGQPTSIAPSTNRSKGWIRGEPLIYASRHLRFDLRVRRKLEKKIQALGGFCACGCGQKTNLVNESAYARGSIAGLPALRLSGHNGPVNRSLYIVDKKTGCWIWQRSRHRTGYGQWTLRGKVTTAHRAMWYKTKRRPPNPKLQIDHLCRNKLCVNPKHLEPVTPAENNRRARVYKAKMKAKSKSSKKK